MAPVKSILVMQTRHLGDLVLSLPLIQNLRLAYPDAKVVLFCRRELAQFIRDYRLADEVVGMVLRRGSVVSQAVDYVRAVRTLRRYRFDLTIDIADTKTTRILHRLINAPARLGYDPPEMPLKWWERQPLTQSARPFGYGQTHFLYRYLSPVEALGLSLRAVAPVIDRAAYQSARVRDLLGAGGTCTVVHAGASFVGRRWPPERFASLVGALSSRGHRVVLIGGPDETAIAQSIAAATPAKFVDLVGKLNLSESCAVIGAAGLFIGNESGPMHIAAALGVPVVGLFGLTNPDLWRPMVTPHRVLRPSHPCPCIAEGVCNSIEPTQAYCVHRLSVDEVVGAVLEFANALTRQAGALPEAGAAAGIPSPS